MVEPLYKVMVEVTIQNRVIAQLYKYQLYMNLLCLALMINPNKMSAVSLAILVLACIPKGGLYQQSTDKCLMDSKTYEHCRLNNMQW